jgi:hypothetical protein
MKKIIVEVYSDGEVKIETQGFTGKSCIKESEFLKELLGTETFKQLTPAYYQRETEGVKINCVKHLPLCG